NVWLDAAKTSPYKFYQFWLNVSDEDAESYIRIFTFLPKETIEHEIESHRQAPHLRQLQKLLAKELTVMVHSENDYETALRASEILFGKATKETLLSISENDFLSVFEGVPLFKTEKNNFDTSISLLEVLVEKNAVFPSKGELRRTIKEGGLSINKEKITDEQLLLTGNDLINNKYLLVQKGKKNYFLVVAE